LSLHPPAANPTVLIFFPAAFEPVSQEELALYQEFLPEFDALHAKLLGISADHSWCHEAFALEAGISFPLLSDTSPWGRVSELYGVYQDREETTARSLFVVDAGGIIRFSEVYPDLLNPGVGDVLTVLEGLTAQNSHAPA
jgi:peroxiredoxin